MKIAISVNALHYLIKKVSERDQPWCRIQNMIYSDAIEYCTSDRCPFCSPDEFDGYCVRHYQDEVV